MIKSARGQNKRELAKKNLQRVKDWLTTSEGKTKKDACAELGMTYKTLNKHLKEISES